MTNLKNEDNNTNVIVIYNNTNRIINSNAVNDLSINTEIEYTDYIQDFEYNSIRDNNE